MEKREIISEIIKKPKKLSPDQKKAVLWDEGNIRIIAGAGGGKTETLTRKIAYLLLVEEIDPSKIVAFTFTEKAAKSMKSRLYQRLEDLGKTKLIKRLGEIYIGTIHSFCLQILEDEFNFGDYDVLDENQEVAFVQRYGWSLGLGEKKGLYSTNCEDFLNSVGVVYNELIPKDKLESEAPDFFNMFRDYEAKLEQHNQLTFDKITYELVMRLEDHVEILKDIEYLLVDEFQDINKAQAELVNHIGDYADVLVVGDPRQSIFQWRGSNEKYFLKFKENFPNVKPISISENRRSTISIVELSNHFADLFEGVSYEHLEPVRDKKGKVEKLVFNDFKSEARIIAEKIEKLVDEDKCNYGDFGILMRSVKTSAEPFVKIFKEKDIPYIVGGKVGLFKRDEAQAIGKLLSWVSEEGFWVQNPYDWSDQLEGEELLESGLEDWSNVVNFSLSSSLSEDLQEWKDNVINSEYSSFKEVYHELLEILGYLKLNPDSDYDAALMANLGRLSTLLGDFESAEKLGGKKFSWEYEFKKLSWYMNSYASKAYEEQSVNDFQDTEAVQITTVHQAKGLEWPIVFVPALVKRRFPSQWAGSQKNWLLPRKLFDAERYEGGIEEEKRLFYVAISRAEDMLFLSYPSSRNQSDFLDMVDDIGIDERKGSNFSLEYESSEESRDEELHTFSATDLIDYIRCPYHYRLNKEWGYIQSTNPLIGYGKALHFCLQYAAELMEKENYNPISAVATAVDERFFLPFSSNEKQKEIKSTARKILINFATEHKDDMKNIEEVEARLEFPLQNATVAGKVDVILKGEESYEIRDYKSSDEVITDEDSKFQVQLYSFGLKEMGWDVAQGSVANLKESRVKNITVNENEIGRSKERAENIIGNIIEGNFEGHPSDFCEKCEYSKICQWRKKNE